ncbi:MAG: aminoacyl-tRNA hydrolase [Candidatus Aminicenantaceae bacterium]
MWTVVGLGNPGRMYSQTRHNAGVMFIKRLAQEWDVKLKRKKYSAKAGEAILSGSRVFLVLPQTYMNQSGLAVRQMRDTVRISTERLIVVFDDLDIPLGEIRVRKAGGPGTHKGMDSVIQELKTTKFPRIRIGVAPQEPYEDSTSFVLSPFAKEEKCLFDDSLEKAKEALEMIVAGDIEKAMNTYNRKTEKEEIT